MNDISHPQDTPDGAADHRALDPVDALLANALKGDPASWQPPADDASWEDRVAERIAFHGIAGLLAERMRALSDWPESLTGQITALARTQATWELRHRIVLSGAIEALVAAGVEALVLKGSALAYTLYPEPVQRFRGDTDVLINVAQIDSAQQVLTAQGFDRVSANAEMVEDREALWQLTDDDGTVHKLDLHWQALDAPSLEGVLPFATCHEGAESLPGFSASAQRLDFPTMLVHAAVHRAKHAVSPYYVGGKAYHDGDRLIWIYDLHLLAKVLDQDGWDKACRLGEDHGVAAICLDALGKARACLGTAVPPSVLDRLGRAPRDTPQTRYLLHDRQFGRAWKNFMAMDGPDRKLSYLRGKIFPSAAFMREKYAHLPRVPLPLLYVWRLAELFVPRPKQRRSSK